MVGENVRLSPGHVVKRTKSAGCDRPAATFHPVRHTQFEETARQKCKRAPSKAPGCFSLKTKTNFTIYFCMIPKACQPVSICPSNPPLAIPTTPPPSLSHTGKEWSFSCQCRVLKPSTDREAIFTHVKPHTKPRSCHRSPSVHLQEDKERSAAV